jgi:hypothetical protein
MNARCSSLSAAGKPEIELKGQSNGHQQAESSRSKECAKGRKGSQREKDDRQAAKENSHRSR